VARSPWLAGLAFLALGCGSKHAPVALTPELAQLTGAWILNEEASDDPQQILKAMRPAEGFHERPPGGGGFPGGGPPGGGSPPGGGGPPGGGAPQGREGPPGRMDRILRAPGWIEISLTDSTAAFLDSTGAERIFFVDGRKTTEKTGRGTIETKARWKDDHLVLERKVSQGGKSSETYSVELGSGRLQVIIEMSRPYGEKMRFTRVYDRAGAAP
jgi:hypothetical protein